MKPISWLLLILALYTSIRYVLTHVVNNEYVLRMAKKEVAKRGWSALVFIILFVWSIS